MGKCFAVYRSPTDVSIIVRILKWISKVWDVAIDSGGGESIERSWYVEVRKLLVDVHLNNT
jgi:hypothetical protein